jgi:hypothetical protein
VVGLVRSAAALGALVGVVLAGCGDSDDSTADEAAGPSTSSAGADLDAFAGRWFGAPVDLIVSDDGSGMLVFPELAEDGSDVTAMTFVIANVNGEIASADVQSNPGNTLYEPGQQITLTVHSDVELALDPDGGTFCRPDRSCVPPLA